MTMKEQMLNWVKDNWSSRWACGLSVVLVISTLAATFSGLDLGEITIGEWAVTLLSGVFTVLLWAYTNRMPKHPRNTIGFDVAIACREERQRNRIDDDFIGKLRQLLGESPRENPFHLIEHNQKIAARLVDKTLATNVLYKTRGHFFVFGTAKLRHIEGVEKHVLSLEGVVRHGPISHEASEAFSREFKEVFPQGLMFSQEGDLFAFEFTAEVVDLVARYIVGTAALISGDFAYAEQLLTSLEARFAKDEKELPPQLARIKNRIPSRMADLLKIQIKILGHRYWMSRSPRFLVQSEDLLDRLRQYDSSWYFGNLHRAICAFVLRRDLREASRYIDACRDVPDTTWRYSEAFLKAYDGDLDGAWKSYKRAFNRPPDPTVPIQSEEFIHHVLDDEPERSQLYFCLGLINFKAKEDYPGAKRDLERFLATTDDAQFANERGLARKWIGIIDERTTPK